jgi:hypothetical protein
MGVINYTAEQINNLLAAANKIGDLSQLATDDKDSIVDAVNETFTDASEVKKSVAAALTGNGVDASEDDTAEELAAKIDELVNPNEPPLRDVNFWDYDGTLLYSYTLSEAQALTELPPLPSHKGLTCQGWNWALSDVKALTDPMNVGANYITDDGKTRLYITLYSPANLTVPLYFIQSVDNGVTIDWGDGSDAETLDGTDKVNTTHEYAEIGDYVITLDPTDDCELGLGTGSSTYCVLGSVVTTASVYTGALKKAELGKNIPSLSSSFRYCAAVETISVPKSIQAIGANTLTGCYVLRWFTVPDGVVSLPNECIRNKYAMRGVSLPKTVTTYGTYALGIGASLQSLAIPGGVTTISSGMLYSNSALSRLIVPASVTLISDNAFCNCNSLAEIHFRATEPPTLAGTSAFANTGSCPIYVPQGSLEAYQAADKWKSSSILSRLQEEPA